MTWSALLKQPMNFQKCWPEAALVIAPFSGHTAFEKEITHELVLATNVFAQSSELNEIIHFIS